MPELGRVTKVDVNSEESRIFVDVSTRPNSHYEKISFRSPGSGVWIVPKVGDVVEVEEVGVSKFVAYSPHSAPSFSLPEGLSEGDVAFKINDNSFLHFDKSGGTVDLKIQADGSIIIGDETNTLRVANENHTHDVTLSDGTTATTTGPSTADLTDTEIE